MGSKERRERARSEIQKLILDAARELFVAEGYEAVTMRKIAEKIEYTPTAIYFYFRDKEALVRALCGEDFETLENRFRQIAARVRDPMECLRQMGFAYLEFGLSGEIAALVAEQIGYISMKSPVKRLGVPNVPIPYSRPLEQAVIPQVEHITRAIGQLMAPPNR